MVPRGVRQHESHLNFLAPLFAIPEMPPTRFDYFYVNVNSIPKIHELTHVYRFTIIFI